MRIRAFFIITAILAVPLQASSVQRRVPAIATSAPGRGALHPAPNDLTPAEQTKRAPTTCAS
jgi:hypothetical protein